MLNYEKISNLGDNIMIRELRRAINQEGDKKTGEANSSRDSLEDSKQLCVFCGRNEGPIEYMGKYFCEECYEELKTSYHNID